MSDFPYLFQNAEKRLLDDVMENAKAPARYLAALEEVWNLSFRGLTTALVSTVESGGLLEGGSGQDAEDAAAAFGALEARRHRARGVGLDMVLGLLNLYRPAYLNLARKALDGDAGLPSALLQLGRFFDRVELALCRTWAQEAEAGCVRDLQQQSLEQVLERDRYVAIFESIPMPILLLDPDLSVRNMNHAAYRLFFGPGAPGAWYYRAGGKPDSPFLTEWFPTFIPDLEAFRADGIPRREGEWTATRAGVPKVFRVILSRMLDLPGAFAGILVTLDDQTDRVHAAQEREHLVGELTTALAEVKQLTGLLPICAWCKKIRDDQGYWGQLESYLASHAGLVFSHGVCPECAEKVRAEQPGYRNPG